MSRGIFSNNKKKKISQLSNANKVEPYGCRDKKEVKIFKKYYKFTEQSIKDWLSFFIKIEDIKGQEYTLDFDDEESSNCCLGQGGNGFVFRYKNNATTFAIKFFCEQKNRDDEVNKSEQIQKLYEDSPPTSPHFRIPCFHSTGEMNFQGQKLFYLIMDCADGTFKDLLCEYSSIGDLGEKNKKLKFMFKYLAETIFILHKANFIHRDIKPENILIKGEYPILADFGLAADISIQNCKKGPKYWPNPEFVQVCDKTSQIIDQKTDIFNLGCLFFYFATNKYPIGRLNLESELQHLDSTLADLILQMLEYDKATRTSDLSLVISGLERIT